MPTFNALYKEIVKNKNLSPNKNAVTDIIISINNAKALFMFLIIISFINIIIYAIINIIKDIDDTFDKYTDKYDEK